MSNQLASALLLVDPSLPIAELLLRYLEFARNYYSKNEQPTKEFVEMGLALQAVGQQ